MWCFFYLCCVQDYQLVVLEYKTKYSDNIHAWYGTVGLHYHAHTHLFFSFLYISKIPRTFFLCSRVLRFKVLRTSTYQVHYNMAYHVCADLLGSLRRMYQHMFFLTLKWWFTYLIWGMWIIFSRYSSVLKYLDFKYANTPVLFHTIKKIYILSLSM